MRNSLGAYEVAQKLSLTLQQTRIVERILRDRQDKEIADELRFDGPYGTNAPHTNLRQLRRNQPPELGAPHLRDGPQPNDHTM